MTDEEVIRQTLSEYCQLIDDARFDDWADLFTVDATFNPFGDPIKGREAIRNWAKTRPVLSDPDRRGRHLTLNSILDIDGDQATVRSDFILLSPAPDGPGIKLVGRYDDSLARDGTRWRFVSRKAVVTPGWGASEFVPANRSG